MKEFWDIPRIFLVFSIVNILHHTISSELDLMGNLPRTISVIIQCQIQLHNYYPKTMWFYNGRRFSVNQTQGESASEKYPDSFDESMENILTSLEASTDWVLPLIIGQFGKQIRQDHTHLTSFIFLAMLNSILELEQFIESNGNRRRDRFLFVGQEESLRTLFQQDTIKGLKDKFGLVVSPEHDTRPQIEILMDPAVYNADGVMIKMTIPERSHVPLLLRHRPSMGRNLPGRHLKISGSLLPTWLYRTANEDGPRGIEYDGSNYRTFSESAIKFNYTFELHAPIGQGYGSLLPNGTWIGMAADLYYLERKFDAAILLGHVLGWYHFIDFASSLDFANLIFVTGHPKQETNSDSFILPFQREVWIAVIGIYVAISLAVFSLLLLKTWSKGKSGGWTVKGAAFQALSIPYLVALEQALSKVPRNVRFVVGIWMVATIVTGTGYRCNLASFLSVPTVVPVPTTFEAIAAEQGYRIVLNNLGVAEEQFFEFSENPTIKKIKRRLGFNPDSIDCATKAFVLQKLACISWTPLITAFTFGALAINTRLDPLIHSTEPALPVSMSIGFLKDSVIVDAITPITSSVYETGLYKKWTDDGYFYFKLMGKAKLENGDKKSELYMKLKEFENAVVTLGTNQAFKIGNLKVPFYAVLFGSFLGGIAFLFEIFCANWERLWMGAKRSLVNKTRPKNSKGKNGKLLVLSQLGRLEIQIRSIC